MKVLSLLPALLGRIADPVERTINSDLEILQVALIEHGPIPLAFRPNPAFGTQLIQESTMFTNSFIQTASSAQTTTNIFQLRSGVWHITGHVVFIGNFDTQSDFGLVIDLQSLDFARNMNLYVHAPVSDISSSRIDVTLTLDETWQLRVSEGATGVGQTITASVSLQCAKLL